MRRFLFVLAIALPLPSLAEPARDTLVALPMVGPYATLDALCRAVLGDGPEVDRSVCTTPPHSCGAGRVAPLVASPFQEARVIQWRGACDFTLRTNAGWWLPDWQQLPALQSFLNNGGRYDSEIDDIAGTDDAAVVVRGTFVHWTCPGKMPWLKYPRFEEWYECEARTLVCAVGPSGKPSCTEPVASSYTTYCRAADPQHETLHRPVARVDYRWTVQASRGQVRLVGPPHAVDGPLPGWFIIAMDADRLRDARRLLTPPRLTLQFP